MSRERKQSQTDRMIEKIVNGKSITDRDMTKLEYEHLGVELGFMRRVLGFGPKRSENIRGIYTDSC
jgi:hypothetical protein